MTTRRRGDWIQTYTGRKFYPLDPDPDQIDVRDIVHSLSNMCRFAGHLRDMYSVGQHSVLASVWVEGGMEAQRQALMHDASEAYLVDVPRPVKTELPEYKAIEARLMNAIAIKLRFTWPMLPAVHRVDNDLLETEMHQLFLNGQHPEAGPYGKVLPMTITVWSPEETRAVFNQRLGTLFPWLQE